MVRVPSGEVASLDGGYFVVSGSAEGAAFDDALSVGAFLAGRVTADSVSLVDVCRWTGGVPVVALVDARPVVVSTIWLALAGVVRRCPTTPE